MKHLVVGTALDTLSGSMESFQTRCLYLPIVDHCNLLWVTGVA